MQYVRNISDSVSTAWNSLNPATLSGAIDVIVVEHEDGTLACSPFHVRFGKFSLLRPSDKKVEFKVNGVKQEYSMKLGEGGEAFFVFETTDNIPQSLQTSPLVSPASSPPLSPVQTSGGDLADPEPLQLDGEPSRPRRPLPTVLRAKSDDAGILTPLSTSPNLPNSRPTSADWSAAFRHHSDNVLQHSSRSSDPDDGDSVDGGPFISERSQSPPPLALNEAVERAKSLAKELSAANIPSKITETGDLMLDMTGFKSNDEDMLRAEVLARKILSEELDGNYDIGALFGFDEEGNLWIYSSEDAKNAAMKKTLESTMQHHHHHHRDVAADAASDPGYHSDGSDVTVAAREPSHRRSESDAGPQGMHTPPRTPTDSAGVGDPNRNYAKTLRLTSDQLRDLNLKPGENSMSFTVNRATCSANMYLWKHETPVVISDIDGTITKSDALGHVLNMIGRDWTHTGIARLYSDIAQNGYNIMYLTSRSVGQADTTRAYVYGVVQDGYKLPHGPTILSPDRTMAALRREIYLRKPHVFKMATLRDIRNLYGPDKTPFYAGFGNRLTDQISYRTVDVPRNRIFTINSNSEVSLDLLSLNKLKMSYVNINEVVDHYFPPVSTLVKGGGEEFTDFRYWRDVPLELDEFSASDSDGNEEEEEEEEEEDDEEMDDGLGDSYISRDSMDDEAARDDVVGGNRTVKGRLASPENLEDADDEEDDEDEDTEDGDGYTSEDHGHDNQMAELRHVEEDVTAEIITGVGHLSTGKPVQK
ncbi:Lipin/Ned1/Smp2-domain-containing protein [Stachybotrys elegans]|uniref:Lipin/Ned1/Smp2-domain-containing protein n=1 Tax=Stachybotrys elegans TaxID=80388 RepID=A0A8K0SRU5_9HYPO|nr:Lipin/Ned1/Smp2-domain-containing protein [Stachybotrys elegans]